MRDLERYSRNVRNENRATITTHKNAPRNDEGVDGDIRITTTTAEGVKLFSKYNGEWYSTLLSKYTTKDKNEDRRAVVKAEAATVTATASDKAEKLFSLFWGAN